MHDAKNRPLKEGDKVLIPATVRTCNGGEDYCNVTLESAHGRRPDQIKETLTLNTGVVLRANEGDENAPEDLFPPVES